MTLRRLAAAAGVAPDTARRALAGAASVRPYIRERVLAAAARHNYRPNVVAATLKGKALPLVPISYTELQNPFFGALAQHIGEVLAADGLEPALCPNEEHLERVCRTLSPCGCIVTYPHDEALVRRMLRQRSVVAVHRDASLFPLGVGTVILDFARAYQAAAAALVAEGRRTVAVCSHWLATWGELGVSNNNYDELFAALAAAGLRVVGPRRGKRYFATPTSLADYLREYPGTVTSVFCENDLHAATLVAALAARGLPTVGNLRIIGSDGTVPLEGVWTLAVDFPAIAREVSTLLRELLDGGRPDQPRRHAVRFVCESGRPPASARPALLPQQSSPFAKPNPQPTTHRRSR